MIDIEKFIEKIKKKEFLTFLDLTIKEKEILDLKKEELFNQMSEEYWYSHIEYSLNVLNHLLERDGRCFIPEKLSKGRVIICSELLDEEHLLTIMDKNKYIEINKENINVYMEKLLNALAINFSYAPEFNVSLYDNKNEIINDYMSKHTLFAAKIDKKEEIVEIIETLNNKSVNETSINSILKKLSASNKKSINYTSFIGKEHIDIKPQYENQRGIWGKNDDDVILELFLLNNFVAKIFYEDNKNAILSNYHLCMWSLIFKTNFNKDNIYLKSIMDDLPSKVNEFIKKEKSDLMGIITLQDICLSFKNNNKLTNDKIEIIQKNNEMLLKEIEARNEYDVEELLHIISRKNLFFGEQREKILKLKKVQEYFSKAVLLSDNNIIIKNTYLCINFPSFITIKTIHKKIFDQKNIKSYIIHNGEAHQQTFVLENNLENVSNEDLWKKIKLWMFESSQSDLRKEIDINYIREIKNELKKYVRELDLESKMVNKSLVKNEIKKNKI